MMESETITESSTYRRHSRSQTPETKKSTEISTITVETRKSSTSPTRIITKKEIVKKENDNVVLKKSSTKVKQQPDDNDETCVDDGKPIWMKKNLLKKPSDNVRTTTSSSSSTRRVISNGENRKYSKDISKNEVDSVTSSYGIGPTDENGLPLFGIRALKKQTQKTVEQPKGKPN